MSFNNESIWKAVTVILLSGMLGGVVQHGLFEQEAAKSDDLTMVIQRLDRVTDRLDDVSQRLSKVEGKLDVALNQKNSRGQK